MLPDEKRCDEIEHELSQLQDRIDGVHSPLYRAGMYRTLAGQADNEAIGQAHLDRVASMTDEWAAALRELQAELERAARWVGGELQQALDSATTGR